MPWVKYILFTLSLFAGCYESNNRLKYQTKDADIDSYKIKAISFTDSLDRIIPQSEKQQSLIYSRGNYSFHVTRYVLHSEVNLYVETGITDSSEFYEKKYYLDNGRIILMVLNRRSLVDDNKEYSQRTFFMDERVLDTDISTTKAGQQPDLFQYRAEKSSKSIRNEVLQLKDAIYQRGEFALLFEDIAAYPKARYLILSRKDVNSYRAALLIEDEDRFMKILLSDPGKYKGRKMTLNWEVRDPFESVYISGKAD